LFADNKKAMAKPMVSKLAADTTCDGEAVWGHFGHRVVYYIFKI